MYQRLFGELQKLRAEYFKSFKLLKEAKSITHNENEVKLGYTFQLYLCEVKLLVIYKY